MTPLPRIGGQAPAARGSDHETCAWESSRIGALKTPPAQGGELGCPGNGAVLRRRLLPPCPPAEPSSNPVEIREQGCDPATRTRLIKGCKFSFLRRFAWRLPC